MEIVYIVLAIIVVAFGVAVIAVNRRRSTPVDRGVTSEPAEVLETPAVPDEAPAVPDEAPAVLDGSDIAVAEAPVRPNLRDRMGRARAAFSDALSTMRRRSGVDETTWEELEEMLLRADVGLGVTNRLLGELRSAAAEESLSDPDALLAALEQRMAAQLTTADRSLRFDTALDGPNIWMFVGVNGVGKTTTIGKVAAQQIADGRRVLMAAGDTFRAAAAEQLGTWAQRSGADLVRGAEGGDPSAVIFDAVERASARGFDLVLADTAGRLHTKTNLMDELRKVRRVAEKGSGVVTETLLVIDATTGQNGLVQAREFSDATEVTGVVLTKLDGSAKGGIVFAIETELGLPVKLVGLGETIEDLVAFEPEEFVAALFAP